MASIGNSKAILGCIFVQYCGYAVFYIFDQVTGIAPSHYNSCMQAHDDQLKEEQEGNAAKEKGDGEDAGGAGAMG